MPAMAADLKDTYSNLALSVMKFSTGICLYSVRPCIFAYSVPAWHSPL